MEDFDGRLVNARVLIDPRSEVNLISENLADRLRNTTRQTRTVLKAIGGSTSCIARKTMTVRLQLRDEVDSTLEITAFVIPNLGITTPRFHDTDTWWPHFEGLRLADPSFHRRRPVDLLLGVDTYAKILREGIHRGPPGTPVAQNTALGWVVFGKTGRSAEDLPAVFTTNGMVNTSLDETLKRFWELEDIEKGNHSSSRDIACENLHGRPPQRQNR